MRIYYMGFLTRGPAWLKIDEATGLLSGTPTESGDYEFTVEAEDDEGDVVFVRVALRGVDLVVGTLVGVVHLDAAGGEDESLHGRAGAARGRESS